MIVSLTGGLGNQLFQYAAGLTIDESGLSLASAFGNPRTAVNGKPEIGEFNLPKGQIAESEKHSSILARKTVGYVLRSSIYPNNWERKKFVKNIKLILANLVISLHYLSPKETVTSENYEAVIQKKKNPKRSFLVGYFQDYRFCSSENVKKILMELSPTASHPELDLMKEESQRSKVLIVHVRRGDYKQENFGILDSDYYHLAIARAFELNTYTKIWLYSDEGISAIDVIPNKYLEMTKLIDSLDFSTSLTFESMRYGHGYVIANSTFSWWAAFLSKTHKAQVFAPRPWFENRKPPGNLIPEGWVEIDR